MKTEKEISRAIELAEEHGDISSQFPSMTYEQGVAEALSWVLGEIEDSEFEFSPRPKP